MPEELYTRGAPGDADTRGESLVNRHLAASRAASEAAARAALASCLPEVDEPLLAAALEACSWDVTAAERYVREFAAATGKPLVERRRPAKSASSDSDSRKRKRRRKERHGDREKKQKRCREHTAVKDSQYGRFGLLKEGDLHEKQPEFIAWLLEVQKRAPDGLAKWEERELFKSFVEDYNTASLPSQKYYNIAKWEAKEAARRQGPVAAAEVDVRGDEAARRAELAAERERAKQAGGSTRLVDHMRLVGKLDGLKEQLELQSALRVAAQVGDSETVRLLQSKLAPDDPRKSAAALNYGFRPSRIPGVP